MLWMPLDGLLIKRRPVVPLPPRIIIRIPPTVLCLGGLVLLWPMLC